MDPTPVTRACSDVIVVGAGLAGLATAHHLARLGLGVIVLSPEEHPGDGHQSASALAQGGLAAAIGTDDSPALHTADTIAAGAGLTDADVAARITAAAPGVVADLLDLGTRFDRDLTGALRLGLEGAHGRHRIVHAHGDASGAEILRAVAAAALQHPRVEVRGSTRVTRLLHDAGAVTGVEVRTPDASRGRTIEAEAVVLATGGIGGLFAHTTNPLTAWGSGLALGLRTGARVRDLELVQFHPTALAVGLDPMPLVSEAVRGEGVALVRGDGTMLPDPLAGRDVVARAVWDAITSGHEVYLDVPGGPADVRDHFARRFPTVHAACTAAGLDPRRDRLPVRPAAHYHMGGLVVDAAGRTDVTGLWAVGEVASTGLHGANRLASNSLLEALVCGGEVAAGIAEHLRGGTPWPATARPQPVPPAPASRPSTAPTRPDRELLDLAAGLYRDGETLRRAAETLEVDAATDDARLVASLLVRAALARTESRGAHRRVDHPASGVARHTLTHLAMVNEPALDLELELDRSA